MSDDVDLSAVGFLVWQRMVRKCPTCKYDGAGVGVPCSHHSSCLDGIVALVAELNTKQSSSAGVTP